MPAHHNLEAYLDAYIKAAGLGDNAKSPHFHHGHSIRSSECRKPSAFLSADTSDQSGRPRLSGPSGAIRRIPRSFPA
jgi:hypothetical protein